jgi:hypothetical protein
VLPSQTISSSIEAWLAAFCLMCVLVHPVGCGEAREDEQEPTEVSDASDGVEALDAESGVDVSDLATADVVADIETDDTSVRVDVREDTSMGVDTDEPVARWHSVDCDNLPEGPFELVKLDGPMASEDLAFDMEGYVIGSNDVSIFKSLYGGIPELFVPNINFRAGLRYLPNGHLVVCSDQTGELIRIDEQGVQHVILGGLSYPNGITVDLDGWVYFTEQSANKVRRVHPFTGESTVLTTKVSAPNGLTFSPDYSTLYIGGFSGVGTIYAMSISEDGVPGKLVPWSTDIGTGMLDGMGADACGNVYVCDYGATVVYRISPDGQDKEIVINGATISGTYLPNMQWGSGIGGWDPYSLYLPDGWKKGIFEVKLGVPGKPKAYP